MSGYNGFTPSQRRKALAWYKNEVAEGRRTPPVVCEACGQTKGRIHAHSEDYSEPFGPHIGQYGLCFACHMLVHGRAKKWKPNA